MRKFIVKYWILSYDTKVFGTKWKHLRVVNTLMPLFVIAGLINFFVLGFDVWQAMAFLPFIALSVWSCLYELKPEDIQYLDWEQELQLMKKPDYAKKKWKFDFPQEVNIKWYQDKHDAKYKGPEKFVEAWRAFHPLAWILLTCLLVGFFGFHEAGFPELRGF